MKKFDEIGQICSDWAHIETPDSPHRVLDSPGGFGQFFQKIGKKIKFEFSEKSRFSGFSGEIPKQTARPQMNALIHVMYARDMKLVQGPTSMFGRS